MIYSTNWGKSSHLSHKICIIKWKVTAHPLQLVLLLLPYIFYTRKTGFLAIRLKKKMFPDLHTTFQEMKLCGKMFEGLRLMICVVNVHDN